MPLRTLDLTVLVIACIACGVDKHESAAAGSRTDTVASSSSSPAAQTTRPWWDKEFGIGVVRYAAAYRYEAIDAIRAAPSVTAETVAVLRRDSLCFTRAQCVRSYGRMIEFDYEVSGWAILGFSDDSAWVHVSLAPEEPSAPTGWVSLRDDSVRALLWSGILPTKQIFFIRPTDVVFYRMPTEAGKTTKKLVRHQNSDEFNYIMSPLEARGTWLKVVLLTPSPMCSFPEPEVVPDTLWIQHLTSEGKPKVFYYTRGC